MIYRSHSYNGLTCRFFSRIVSPVCFAPASTEIDQYADKRAAIMGWGLAGKHKLLFILIEFLNVYFLF